MQWSIDYVEHYATETIKMFKANMADGPFDALLQGGVYQDRNSGAGWHHREPDYAQRGGIRKHGQTQSVGDVLTLWQTTGA